MTRQQKFERFVRRYNEANVAGNVYAWVQAAIDLAKFVASNSRRIKIESD